MRDFPDSPFAGKVVHDFSVIEQDPEVSIVVETIGGAKAALDFTRRALQAGKSVITSNKELVAEHGYDLLKLAEEHGVSYLFEASVGGGIPILRPLTNCLSANEVAGCDLLVPGDDPTIIKEGMLNDLYACWIETYDTDRGADITHHFLLLYDADKLCVVFLGGDWDVTEKIAENMTIVQTGIPTPEASQNFTYVGVFG